MIIKAVLDTNVVLDWLYFSDPACLTLASAIKSGEVEPITSESCLAELRQVIGRLEMGRGPQGREQLLQEYCAHACVFEAAGAIVDTLPRCSDPCDQKFIELAWRSGAQYLLSRDKAVLKLSRRLRPFGFQALTPAKFSVAFNQHLGNPPALPG